MEQNTQLWLFPNKETKSLTLLPGESASFSFVECFDGKFSYELFLMGGAERNIKLGFSVNGKNIYERMVFECGKEPRWGLFGCFQVVKGEHEITLKNSDTVPFTALGALVTRNGGYIGNGTAEKHRAELLKGRDINDIFLESGMKFSEDEPADKKKARLDALYRQGFLERYDQDAAENRCRCGVPLGGVGTGKIELDRDGVFTAITVNNNFDVPLYKTEGSFFAVRCGDESRILQRVNYNKFPFPTVESIDFEGVFPTARLAFHDSALPVGFSLFAYSLLPHGEVKNAALPAAVFELEAKNDTDKAQSVSVMLSWENLLGTGGSMAFKSKDQSRPGSYIMNTWNPGFTWSDRTGTYQQSVVNSELLFKTTSTSPNIQSLGEYSLACLSDTSRVKKSWKINDGGELWNEFFSGSFSDVDYAGNEDGYDYVAGAVADDFILQPGESRKTTFILTWHMPSFPDKDGKNIGVYYDNFFSSSGDVLSYVKQNRKELLEKTLEIKYALFASSLSERYKTKLMNDMFPIVTCSWFDKAGHFSINEAPTGMMGCLGTMDQRLACNVIYTNFFHALDRLEMLLFAKNQGENGSISHDVGFGCFFEKPRGGSWSDLCSSFIIQVYKDYIYTADENYFAEMYPRCKRAVAYQLSTDRDGDGIPDVGSGLGTTYDTYHWYGASSFVASLWLAELRCCEKMAEYAGDTAFADECRRLFAVAQESAVKKLWCEKYAYGKYFISYNDTKNGKISENCFIAQLAGAWAARLLGLGDIFPREMIKEALETIYKRNVTLNGMKIMNDETTPEGDFAGYGYTFVQYDEVYFGCLAMYYGLVEKGLEAFDRVYDATETSPWNIVLTHFADGNRTGLPYYMTNPASFFLIEALSGFIPDVKSKTLTISPAEKDKALKLPLFSPKMWLMLDYSVSGNERIFRLETLKADEKTVFTTFVTECENAASVTVNGKSADFMRDGININIKCELPVEAGGVNIIKIIKE